MIPLIVLILLAIALMSVVFFMKGKNSAADQEPKLLTSEEEQKLDLLKLKVDDVVSYFGDDYVVEGRLDYDEEGWPWVCYLLVGDDDAVKWLSVEDDDRIEASMWTEVDLMVSGERPPEFLEYDNEKFKLVEFGRANVKQSGKTGNKEGLSMSYFEYKGDENMLSVEQWGESYEVSIGQDINPVALELYRL